MLRILVLQLHFTNQSIKCDNIHKCIYDSNRQNETEFELCITFQSLAHAPNISLNHPSVAIFIKCVYGC